MLSVIAAGLVWAFGEAVFGVRLPAGGLHLAVSFLLSFASFAAIGCLIGAAVSSPRAAQGAGLMLFFVMLFLSGAGPPVGIMSHTMVHIADFLPLTYAVTAIQDAWNGRLLGRAGSGGPGHGDHGGELVVAARLPLGLMPVAHEVDGVLFRAAPADVGKAVRD